MVKRMQSRLTCVIQNKNDIGVQRRQTLFMLQVWGRELGNFCGVNRTCVILETPKLKTKQFLDSTFLLREISKERSLLAVVQKEMRKKHGEE